MRDGPQIIQAGTHNRTALSSGSDSRTIPVHFPMEFYFVRTPFEIVNNRSHGHERVK